MLAVLEELFLSLKSKGIFWAVWKSLENLDQALTGDDDLDVLFLPMYREQTMALFQELGWVPDMCSPGSLDEDLIVCRGFDEEAGKHVSVHVHYACRFGSKQYKEYRFPHEEDMLKHVVFREGVSTIGDDFFLVTRILQGCVKNVGQDPFLCELVVTMGAWSLDIKARAFHFLELYFGSDVELVLKQLAEGNIDILREYHMRVHNKLNSENPVDTYIKLVDDTRPSAGRDEWFAPRFRRNKLGIPLGIILAGHEGVGKSTVTRKVEQTLGRVTRIRQCYLGRNTWSGFNRLINSLRLRRGLSFVNYLWPVTSTIELLLRYGVSRLLMKFGFMIVYDRCAVDLLLKYRSKQKRYSWFPLAVAKWMLSHDDEIRFLLVADSDTVVVRTNGDVSTEFANKYQRLYQDTCSQDFIRIDTTSISAKQVCHAVVSQVFRYCAGGGCAR